MDISPEQVQRLYDKLDQTHDKMVTQFGEIQARLLMLETLRETEADRCRYVPDIVTARHTVTVLAETRSKVEANAVAIQLLHLNWAKLVGLMVGSGVLGGTLGNLLSGLLP